VALCQARISTKPLWGFSSSNPYHSQSRAEQFLKPHLNLRSCFPYIFSSVDPSNWSKEKMSVAF
jgi:hypothetical protein